MVFEVLQSIQKTIYAPYGRKVKNNVLVLTEDDPQATCTKITFNAAFDVLAYKFDQVVRDGLNNDIREAFPFLAENSPLRYKCDYLLFHARRSSKGKPKLHVFICNMKSGNRGTMDEQLRAGRILAEFLLQTSLRCHNSWHSNTSGYQRMEYEEFRREYVEFREVAIANKRFAEQKNASKLHDGNKRRLLECEREYELNFLMS
jgi:hypothetical protein